MSEPKRLAEGVYAVSRRGVNAFILLDRREVALVDTGGPGSALPLVEAVVELGRRTDEIKHVVVTHCHADHSGSAAALRRMVPAAFYMHADDAALVRDGRCRRPLRPSGARGRLLSPLLAMSPKSIEPFQVDHEIADADELPFGGGLRVVHTPGHCAGQVSLLAATSGVVFAGDAAANLLGVSLAPLNEDEALAEASLRRLVDASRGLDVACFGHGRAVERAKLAA